MEVSGLKRTGVRGLVRGLALLPRAFARSRAILRRFRPDLVVGVGGYASGPMVLAAALSGLPDGDPRAEQPPRASPTACSAASCAACSSPSTRRGASSARASCASSATPCAEGSSSASPGAARRRRRARGPSLLVLGGSQGSHAVNELASSMVQVLKARGILPRVVHQTGPGEIDRMALYYEALGLADRVEARAFIDDMPAVLADAALVVARAGALTLAELAIMGRPAILIPLPTAADDHQTLNALEFQRAGAAVVVPQYGTTPPQLANVIQTLLGEPERLARMSEAMRGLARPNATRDIVDELRTLVEGRRGHRRARDVDAERA